MYTAFNYINYSARCLKQFLKVSTELLNIYVIYKEYQEPQYLAGSIKTTETHNRIFRRCVNIVSRVRCHVNFVLKVSNYLMCTNTYRIYSICAAPSNCVALRYYLKGFVFVSGNKVNCTTPSNCTAPYFLLVLPHLKYSYPSQCK